MGIWEYCKSIVIYANIFESLYVYHSRECGVWDPYIIIQRLVKIKIFYTVIIQASFSANWTLAWVSLHGHGHKDTIIYHYYLVSAVVGQDIKKKD